jgi:hypothetical protein
MFYVARSGKITSTVLFGKLRGKEAKKQSYGFIRQTFRELKSGVKSWSEKLCPRQLLAGIFASGFRIKTFRNLRCATRGRIRGGRI